jgi:hypothetical protein
MEFHVNIETVLGKLIRGSKRNCLSLDTEKKLTIYTSRQKTGSPFT